MKPVIRFLLPALLASFSALVIAAEPTTAEKISSYAHERKAEAVAEGKRLIAEADKKIAEMKKQTQHSSAEAKAAHAANMKELAQKKKEAQAQLGKLQRASAKTWDATKEGFANAYQAMRASFDKASGGAKGSP
jgi:vesicle coat complex subunit